MEYTKDGIVVGGVFISLSEIKKNILLKRIVEDNLVLLKINVESDKRGRNSIYENIVRKREDIYFLVKSLTNRQIYFVDIFGKHGHVDVELREEVFKLVFDTKEVLNFLIGGGDWVYNHSFLEVFHDSLLCGACEDEFSGTEFERLKNILYPD